MDVKSSLSVVFQARDDGDLEEDGSSGGNNLQSHKLSVKRSTFFHFLIIERNFALKIPFPEIEENESIQLNSVTAQLPSVSLR